jgi:choline-sulfatase
VPTLLRSRLLPLLILSLTAASAAATCWRPALTVAYDLVERLPSAERWSSREVVLFGTPDAEPHLADGFYQERSPVGRAGFVWSRHESELSFTWPETRPRTAVIDVAPFAGVRNQSVSIYLNGTPVEATSLNESRHRYRVALPAQGQRAGENRLRFVFASDASPAQSGGNAADRRRLAAAFYSLVVGSSDDEGIEELLGRGAPTPFSMTTVGGVPGMTFVGPSMVRYAVRAPAQGELRFTPELHPQAQAAGESVSFRVTVESRPGDEREVWSTVIGPSDKPREVRVGLGVREGTLIRVGFHVGKTGTGRATWGTWMAPRILVAGGSSQAGAASTQGEANPIRKQVAGGNVLLVVLDAARARSFGAYCQSGGTTPNIDRLASEGVVFRRAFTPAVYTLAAMSSMWTSQYPDRHHADVSFSAQLPADRLTLADVLSAQGIHTAGFVANQVAGSFNGFDRGFSEFHDVWRDRGSRASSLVDAVVPWLSTGTSRRFFAYVHFREPHAPYDPPPPFDGRFAPDDVIPKAERAGSGLDARLKQLNQGARAPLAGEIEEIRGLYEGNLASADDQFGRLRKEMEAKGLWEGTTVIVTADHGEGLFEHGWIGHNTQVFDESTHIPLVIRFANGARAPRWAVEALVDLRDIAPTIADLLGVLGKGGSDREFTGRSLLDLLADAKGQEFVLSRTVWDRPVYGLRDERWKAILNTRTGSLQLFDLSADPAESRDVSAADPIRTAYYRQTLENAVARLTPVRAAETGRKLTREQCESLKALGYVGADVKCD